jgi:hypothetical protein
MFVIIAVPLEATSLGVAWSKRRRRNLKLALSLLGETNGALRTIGKLDQ